MRKKIFTFKIQQFHSNVIFFTLMFARRLLEWVDTEEGWVHQPTGQMIVGFIDDETESEEEYFPELKEEVEPTEDCPICFDTFELDCLVTCARPNCNKSICMICVQRLQGNSWVYDCPFCKYDNETSFE